MRSAGVCRKVALRSALAQAYSVLKVTDCVSQRLATGHDVVCLCGAGEDSSVTGAVLRRQALFHEPDHQQLVDGGPVAAAEKLAGEFGEVVLERVVVFGVGGESSVSVFDVVERVFQRAEQRGQERLEMNVSKLFHWRLFVDFEVAHSADSLWAGPPLLVKDASPYSELALGQVWFLPMNLLYLTADLFVRFFCGWDQNSLSWRRSG